MSNCAVHCYPLPQVSNHLSNTLSTIRMLYRNSGAKFTWFYRPTGSNSTHCHLHRITCVLDNRPTRMNWEVSEGVHGRSWRGSGTSEVLRNRLGTGQASWYQPVFPSLSSTCISGILCVINLIQNTLLLLTRIVWLMQWKEWPEAWIFIELSY